MVASLQFILLLNPTEIDLSTETAEKNSYSDGVELMHLYIQDVWRTFPLQLEVSLDHTFVNNIVIHFLHVW